MNMRQTATRWSWADEGTPDVDGIRTHHKRVTRHFAATKSREFQVGDTIVVASSDGRPWFAQLVGLFEKYPEEDDERHEMMGKSSRKSSADRMKCSLRWLYSYSDVAEQTDNIPKNMSQNRLFFSDHLEIGTNSVEVIQNLVCLFPSNSQAKQFKNAKKLPNSNPYPRFQSGDKVRVSDRYFDNFGVSNPLVRKLNPNELSWLLSNPTVDHHFEVTSSGITKSVTKSLGKESIIALDSSMNTLNTKNNSQSRKRPRSIQLQDSSEEEGEEEEYSMPRRNDKTERTAANITNDTIPLHDLNAQASSQSAHHRRKTKPRKRIHIIDVDTESPPPTMARDMQRSDSEIEVHQSSEHQGMADIAHQLPLPESLPEAMEMKNRTTGGNTNGKRVSFESQLEKVTIFNAENGVSGSATAPVKASPPVNQRASTTKNTGISASPVILPSSDSPATPVSPARPPTAISDVTERTPVSKKVPVPVLKSRTSQAVSAAPRKLIDAKAVCQPTSTPSKEANLSKTRDGALDTPATTNSSRVKDTLSVPRKDQLSSGTTDTKSKISTAPPKLLTKKATGNLDKNTPLKPSHVGVKKKSHPNPANKEPLSVPRKDQLSSGTTETKSKISTAPPTLLTKKTAVNLDKNTPLKPSHVGVKKKPHPTPVNTSSVPLPSVSKQLKHKESQKVIDAVKTTPLNLPIRPVEKTQDRQSQPDHVPDSKRHVKSTVVDATYNPASALKKKVRPMPSRGSKDTDGVGRNLQHAQTERESLKQNAVKQNAEPGRNCTKATKTTTRPLSAPQSENQSENPFQKAGSVGTSFPQNAGSFGVNEKKLNQLEKRLTSHKSLSPVPKQRNVSSLPSNSAKFSSKKPSSTKPTPTPTPTPTPAPTSTLPSAPKPAPIPPPARTSQVESNAKAINPMILKPESRLSGSTIHVKPAGITKSSEHFTTSMVKSKSQETDGREKGTTSELKDQPFLSKQQQQQQSERIEAGAGQTEEEQRTGESTDEMVSVLSNLINESTDDEKQFFFDNVEKFMDHAFPEIRKWLSDDKGRSPNDVIPEDLVEKIVVAAIEKL